MPNNEARLGRSQVGHYITKMLNQQVFFLQKKKLPCKLHVLNTNTFMNVIIIIFVNPQNLSPAKSIPWSMQNVTQTEKPNSAVNLFLLATLFIATNNYKWTWHPCVGTAVLARKCRSLRNNGGVKRVRPQEGLGACFPYLHYCRHLCRPLSGPAARSSLARSSYPLKS